MSTVTRPRGPLPPRVYWTRRLLTVALVLAVVAGVARLVTGGGESAPTPSGSPAAASASTSSGPTASAGPTPETTAEARPDQAGTSEGASSGSRKDAGKPAKKKTPLPAPTGPCRDEEIIAAPVLERAVADSDIAITLELTTVETVACTWEASPQSLVVRLTSGSDRIWSTQDCPEAIGRQTMVVRKDHAATMAVTWSGRRSDDECSRTTAWAEPGFYHATAAALGAEPTEKQFELVAPAAPTITPSPTAQPKKKRG